MIDAPLALAFTAGMVAAFNPCGFALLPAYLSYYVGVDEPGEGPGPAPAAAVVRALTVGATVTAGFVLVFGIAGTLVTELSLSVQRVAPWLSIVLGLGLLVLGASMLKGFQPRLSLPKVGKAASGRGSGAMFVFGVSYATVSLSCTLPVFLAVVAGTFSDASFVSGLAGFVAYAMGMGAVLLLLTMAVALARRSLVAGMRRAVPHVQRFSGGLLVAAGAYVAYYGWYEIQVNRDADAPAGPVAFVTGLSGDVSNWVQETGALRIGLVSALVAATILASAVAWGRRRQSATGASQTTLSAARSRAND